MSTGIFGYPIEDATHIALDATRVFLDTPEGDKVADHHFPDGVEDVDRFFSLTVSFLSFGATETETFTGL